MRWHWNCETTSSLYMDRNPLFSIMKSEWNDCDHSISMLKKMSDETDMTDNEQKGLIYQYNTTSGQVSLERQTED